jgi:hypothetical protein
MSEWVERAIQEALGLLRADGREIEDARILGQSNRLVAKLLPSGLIAKIARVDAYEQLAREVAVAAHVATCGGPVAPPASEPGPYRSRTIALSVWEPMAFLGEPPEAVALSSYLVLRPCLDSFRGALPDYRETIFGAKRLADESDLVCLANHDANFLRAVFEQSLSSLSSFRWQDQVLHGDAHSGNLALTPEGPRWLDFESACIGPLEWELTTLGAGAAAVARDPGLLRVLVGLRRACVVTWCAVRPNPNAQELEAIVHHLAALKAEHDPDRSLTI